MFIFQFNKYIFIVCHGKKTNLNAMAKKFKNNG